MIARAVGTVDVHVAVHAILLGARWRTAEVHPAVGAVVFEVESLPGRLDLLTVTTPAVEKPVRAGADPLIVAHGNKIVPCAIIGYFDPPWLLGTTLEQRSLM